MTLKDYRTQFTVAKSVLIGFLGLTSAFSACTSNEGTGSTLKAAGEAVKNSVTDSSSAMVYVGTYANADAESIYGYKLNVKTGELKQVLAVKAGPNPSFLTLDKDRQYLYAVNETGDFEGKESGAVSAFAVDQQSGNLTLLNRVASMGGSPCHISIDHTGKTVLVANYMGGNVSAYQIAESGQLTQATDVEQHKGSGPNKDRQKAPHAHYVAPDPENGFVLAVDLGTDEVMSYKLNAGSGTLDPNTPGVAFTTKPGAGPRHLTFHSNGQYAYLINELNSTIDVLRYDSRKGTFDGVQTIATIPANFKENNQCAEVKASADGKFLYGSNRGHNSIVVYSIEPGTGKLSLVEHVSTGGNWPRDFSLDLTGDIMLVANERSNNIVSFRRDSATGKLTPTGHQIEVSKPVCVQVVESYN